MRSKERETRTEGERESLRESEMVWLTSSTEQVRGVREVGVEHSIPPAVELPAGVQTHKLVPILSIQPVARPAPGAVPCCVILIFLMLLLLIPISSPGVSMFFNVLKLHQVQGLHHVESQLSWKHTTHTHTHTHKQTL